MSISDLIVVMKDGVIQQIGAPQAVYDSPDNLFVAKFLGTPPINVFAGRAQNGKLYIGDEAVLDANLPDGEITVAVRPEGFDPDPSGCFTCKLTAVEVMGRDVSIVAAHPACEAPAVRAIVSAEELTDVSGSTVRFRLKPGKVFAFDRETGARLM